MKKRKLGILLSAVCGILCVLLIALWVRSYWRTEGIARQTRGDLRDYGWREGVLYSGSGESFVAAEDHPWKTFSKPLPIAHAVSNPRLLPGIDRGDDHYYWIIPFWLPTLVMGMLAVAPWCTKRSSPASEATSSAATPLENSA
jgi:hypothetical protein